MILNKNTPTLPAAPAVAAPIDWQEFADQTWAQHADPVDAEMVAYVDVDGMPGEIWIERHAVYTTWMDPESASGGILARFTLAAHSASATALMMSRLRAKMTADDLLALGFELVF